MLYSILQEISFLSNWLADFESYVYDFAKVIVLILEVMGIIVIIFGALKTVYHYISNVRAHTHFNVKIDLANSLSLGLEFKMGAEIINTVVVRQLEELMILGIIIVLRALLALLIHWEIKTERKEEAMILEESKKKESLANEE